MICSRLNDKEHIRYNYKFVSNGEKVEISNKDFHDIITYVEWCKNYYIVDKWKTV